MPEKIVISNLAGIDYIEMELGEINIIIGPQATGKSICAKSLYFFKSLFRDLLNYLDEDFEKREFDNAAIKKFNEYFPPQFLGLNDFKLEYSINDNFISIYKQNGKTKLAYSSQYIKQLNFLRTEKKRLVGKNKNQEEDIESYRIRSNCRENILQNLAVNIDKKSSYSQYFLPAGRSFFALLQRNIFSFLSSSRAVDPFLIEFGALYERIKDFPFMVSSERQKSKDRKIFDEIQRLSRDIVHGTYNNDNGKDFLITEDGRKIGLSNASSGQQETLPLALILSKIPFLYNSRFGSTIYIEEPEAHIFPDSQKKIVEFIAYIFNKSQYPLQFVITTHSPYILSSFNNLLYATSVFEETGNAKKINSIIPRDYWLNSRSTKAYFISDGVCSSILSDDSKLIDSAPLDYVSNEVGRVFDQLIDI
jgi:AAA15 family ATPase/GTPase